jgi:hypothetical protein
MGKTCSLFSSSGGCPHSVMAAQQKSRASQAEVERTSLAKVVDPKAGVTVAECLDGPLAATPAPSVTCRWNSSATMVFNT